MSPFPTLRAEQIEETDVLLDMNYVNRIDYALRKLRAGLCCNVASIDILREIMRFEPQVQIAFGHSGDTGYFILSLPPENERWFYCAASGAWLLKSMLKEAD